MPRKTTAIKTKPAKPANSTVPAPPSPTPDEQPEELPLPAVAPCDIVRLKCCPKLLYKVLAVYSTNAIAHTHDPSLAEEWATLKRQDDGQTASWKVMQLEKVEAENILTK
jgi:hypothetical protein